MRFAGSRVGAALVGLMLLSAFGSASADAQVSVLALGGQQAIGEPVDIKYLSFGSPVIGPDGTFGFSAITGTIPVTNPKYQISYIGTLASNLTVESQQGVQATGAPPGAVFFTCGVTELGNNGFGTGIMTINGAGITSSAIFAGTPSTWTCYAYQGLTAPGTGGAAYTGFFFSPSVNAGGDVAFTGNTNGPLGGVFLESGGTVTNVAVSGLAAPGQSLPFFQFTSAPAISDSGKVIFNARTGVSGNPGQYGIWSGTPGSLQMIAATGSPAPGVAGGVTFSSVSLGTPTTNHAGQIAFRGGLTDGGTVTSANDTGIWSNITGTLAPVIRAGDQATGLPAGTTYTSFQPNTNGYSPVLNNVGQIAFISGLQGDGAVTQGVFVGTPGALTPIATQNQSLPGLPGYFFSGFSTLNINDVGQMVFLATFTGPGIFSSNNTALLSYDPNAGLQLVARVGVVIPGTNISPNHVILTSDNNGYQAGSLSNTGQFVFSDGGNIFEAPVTSTGKTYAYSQFTNASRSDFSNGAKVTVNGSVTNTGFLSTGFQSAGNNTITTSGGVINTGKIELFSSGDMLTAKSLNNLGAVGLSAGTTLVLGSGAPPASTGYRQMADGTLQEILAGNATFGQISVAGPVALGGGLDVSLQSGFVPTIGESFLFLTGQPGTLTGTFATVTGTPFANGFWQVAYNNAAGTVTLTASPVPEPASLAVVLLATGTILCSRRIPALQKRSIATLAA